MQLVRLFVLALAMLASVFITTTTQAMYAPHTGGFLQRDPGRAAAPGRPLIPRPGDGYQDGMNLYAGHFAMHGALDPSGLSIADDLLSDLIPSTETYTDSETNALGDRTNLVFATECGFLRFSYEIDATRTTNSKQDIGDDGEFVAPVTFMGVSADLEFHFYRNIFDDVSDFEGADEGICCCENMIWFQIFTEDRNLDGDYNRWRVDSERPATPPYYNDIDSPIRHILEDYPGSTRGESVIFTSVLLCLDDPYENQAIATISWAYRLDHDNSTVGFQILPQSADNTTFFDSDGEFHGDRGRSPSIDP